MSKIFFLTQTHPHNTPPMGTRRRFQTTIYEATSTSSRTRRPPDDIIAEREGCPDVVPVRQRSKSFQPPEAELLNAIHYYVAMKYPGKHHLFDESALLAMGYLVQHWVDENTNDKSHNLYAEVVNGKGYTS